MRAVWGGFSSRASGPSSWVWRGGRPRTGRGRCGLDPPNRSPGGRCRADPHFAESVILVVQYDPAHGTVGLILNRRTEIPLSRLFPKVQHAPADPVYMGGPVALTAVQALLRPSKAEQATPVLTDLYESMTARLSPSQFRLYLGSAGWAPGQLEWKLSKGRGWCFRVGFRSSSMRILIRCGRA
jgi:hypothetical protein